MKRLLYELAICKKAICKKAIYKKATLNKKAIFNILQLLVCNTLQIFNSIYHTCAHLIKSIFIRCKYTSKND